MRRAYTDNGAATLTYQDGEESAAAQKLVRLEDKIERTTTDYFYDAYDNLCGWKKGDGHLEVQQIAAGTTKYTFGANEKYFCNVTYDSNKILSPRIASTSIYCDPDEDGNDDLEEIKTYTKKYEYDNLGRIEKKKTDFITALPYTSSTYKNEETTEYLSLNEYNFNIPKESHYTEEYSYSSGGGGAIGIIQSSRTNLNNAYQYDNRGRLISVTTAIKVTETKLISKEVVNRSQIKTYSYDNYSRLTSENDSIFGNRTYTYGSNGKISKAVVGGSTRYYTYNSLDQLTEYNGNTYTYDEMGNRATKRVGSSTIRYKYVRGNLLSEMNGFLYNYNCNGVRYQKYANGVTTTYYLDGEKILGEDRSDGTKLRYFYDIDGLCGIEYNGTRYNYVRNAYGDVIAITSYGTAIAYYNYDAWGNCMVEQYNDANDIGNINPFRWKGHYYDVERGLYYANGSYYDPEVGLHVDAMPVSAAIENAFEVFGLDLCGLMCDNILAYLPCVYSIFATLDLSPDPLYDPDANKSGWELFWKGVAEWFNGLSNEEKISWGIAALIAACLIAAATSFATGGTSGAMLAAMANVFMGFAVGVVSSVAITTAVVAISGGDVAEAIANSTADAVFLGGIFSFISAGISAVKIGIRSAYNAKLPGSSQTGGQACSTVNQCFKEGTLVETEEGLKPIEEIEVGDKVLAYDEATGEQAYKPVVQLFRNTTKEWQYVYIEGETYLLCRRKFCSCSQ